MTTVFKVIGAILLIGTPGSLELDNITLYEAVLQGLLGVALLYGGIYIDEIKKGPLVIAVTKGQMRKVSY